ncbi:MAG: 5'-methylthioadenosine/adenosylhomocysteine nucleosidase [Acholeplasmatales bacterium]|nr:MAG: 5'-methylthioadenosine/adenosylhomocysteine nucleosidase [Acholeplasmatales bacterium]
MHIGLLYAMPEERAAFTAHLSDYTTAPLDGLTSYVARIGKHDLTLVECGIGKVNAAVAATKLIREKSIDLLISTGVSGGVMLDPKSLVLARAVAYHDVDVRSFGQYVKGQLPGMPPFFPTDDKVRTLAHACAEIRGFESYVGMVVSGDQFLTDSAVLNDMHALYDDVVATDMEAAAVGHVAYMEGVPCLIIRSISDRLDTPGQIDDFSKFLTQAAKRAAELVHDVVQAL